MRSYHIHLNSNFHIRNLLDLINRTCEIIARQNMTLGGQSLRSLLIKFTWEQQKNKAGNLKAIYNSGYQNYSKVIFYRFAICNIKKLQFVNQKLDIAYF